MTLLLRILAVAFAIGAVVAGIIGYRLSNQPEPVPSTVQAPPAENVVEVVQALRAGEPIVAGSLALRQVPARPAGSFSTPQQAIGLVPVADIAAGEILNKSQLVSPGQLQRHLHPGERAVAIKVDEIVGLGGYAQPGDLVDVLLYLRPSQETKNASSAQVVLSGVRLLAFGESVQGTTSGEPSVAETTGVAKPQDKAASRAKTVTSAVLAVPEAAAPKLMLAANSGNLRLALRPVEGSKAAVAASDAQLIRLTEIAGTAKPESKPSAPRRPAAPAVVIHEGESVRTAQRPLR